MGEFCVKVDIFDGSITAQWAKIGQFCRDEFVVAKFKIS